MGVTRLCVYWVGVLEDEGISAPWLMAERETEGERASSGGPPSPLPQLPSLVLGEGNEA